MVNSKRKPRSLNCRGLLFDLDGVLIDSSSNIERHWRNWGARHNLDVSNIMQIAHGVRTVETMRRVAAHLDAEAEAARFPAAEVVDTNGVVLISGAKELLGSLPGEAWAIVTSAGRDLAPARLRAVDLPVPEVLVTADDVRQGKPSPEPYLLGAQRLDQPPAECVVIEDSPAGIQAARAAGIRVVGIASTHTTDELEGCDLVVARLADLHVTLNREAGPGLQIWGREL